MILDPLGGETPSFSVDLLKSWTNAKYVSLVMPLLPSTDKYGIPGGLIQSATDLSFNVLKVRILLVWPQTLSLLLYFLFFL